MYSVEEKSFTDPQINLLKDIIDEINREKHDERWTKRDDCFKLRPVRHRIDEEKTRKQLRNPQPGQQLFLSQDIVRLG